MRLIATVFWKPSTPVMRAFQTSAMPPTPMRSSRRYCPKSSPAAAGSASPARSVAAAGSSPASTPSSGTSRISSAKRAPKGTSSGFGGRGGIGGDGSSARGASAVPAGWDGSAEADGAGGGAGAAGRGLRGRSSIASRSERSKGSSAGALRFFGGALFFRPERVSLIIRSTSSPGPRPAGRLFGAPGAAAAAVGAPGRAGGASVADAAGGGGGDGLRDACGPRTPERVCSSLRSRSSSIDRAARPPRARRSGRRGGPGGRGRRGRFRGRRRVVVGLPLHLGHQVAEDVLGRELRLALGGAGGPVAGLQDAGDRRLQLSHAEGPGEDQILPLVQEGVVLLGARGGHGDGPRAALAAGEGGEDVLGGRQVGRHQEEVGGLRGDRVHGLGDVPDVGDRPALSTQGFADPDGHTFVPVDDEDQWHREFSTSGGGPANRPGVRLVVRPPVVRPSTVPTSRRATGPTLHGGIHRF